jgi:hypothetical protein
MSVLASCYLPDGAWAFNVQPESPSPGIEIGFSCDHLPVEFDDLSFGLKVFANGLEAFTKSYPPEGVRYVSTDQQYMTHDRVDLAADDVVVLDVWMVNAGERHEASTTFTVPRPQQPYPSWVWEDGGWQPPVPYPDDDGLYMWDEDIQNWTPYDPQEPQ